MPAEDDSPARETSLDEVRRASVDSPSADPVSADRVQYLRRVGVLAGQLFRHAEGRGCWSARIPVDPDLLPETVLLLGYSPTLVSVHFDTRDWGVRELVRGHCREFEAMIRNRLAPQTDLVITV